MFDNMFQGSKTKKLLTPQNENLSRAFHDQGDTHQCWAFALATMLQNCRTGMKFQI